MPQGIEKEYFRKYMGAVGSGTSQLARDNDLVDVAAGMPFLDHAWPVRLNFIP